MELIGRIGEAMQVIRSDHIEPLFARYGLQVGGSFDVLATLRRAGRNEDGYMPSHRHKCMTRPWYQVAA